MHFSKCLPIHSESLGVNPNQCKEAYDHSVRIGVPTEFDNEGQAVFRSEGHKKNYCREMSHRLKDQDTSDSDPEQKRKEKGCLPQK
jgi:hypothetical protein